MKEDNVRKKVALMSYAMDNRKAKGIALYTRKLIEGLLADPKFDYYLVHYEKVDDPIYNKAHEIIMPKVRLPYGSRFISQMMFFWKYRKEPFDIVHWFHPRVYPFYSFVPAKKVVVTMHGAGDITAPQYFVFSRLVFNFVLKYFHKRIDRVIVVSNHAKSEVEKYYGIAKDKIVSIYNGGGENYMSLKKQEALEVVKRRYNLEVPYVLDVSRFLPHKNVVRLIKAYDLMRSKYPDHAEKLVVVGGSASKNVEEYKARKNSKFSKDIIFVDFVEAQDLNAIYSASEVFVFPSLDEGFGLPVLEAMASGVPVVTSNIEAIKEVGGDAVAYVDPKNIEEIAEAMHDTLINESKRGKMTISGLARAKEFTWSKMVEKTEAVYKSLI